MLTTTQFSSVLGVQHALIGRIKQGGRRPLQTTPKGDLWSEVQVLAEVVRRGLRLLGVKPRDAEVVARLLWPMGHEGLEAEFATGHTHLLVVGHSVLLRLLDPTSVRVDAPDTLPLLRTESWLLDVQAAWRALQDHVNQLRRPAALPVEAVGPRRGGR